MASRRFVTGDKVTADSQTLRQINIDPDTLIPFHTGIHETVRWYQTNWLPDYWQKRQEMLHGDTEIMEAVV